MLDAGLLLRVLRILGGLPGFQPLKADALGAEQGPQALVADVVDYPSTTRKSASLARLQVENGRSCSAGLDLATFLITRRWPSVNFGGWPPRYFG